MLVSYQCTNAGPFAVFFHFCSYFDSMQNATRSCLNLEQENAKPTGKYLMKSRYYNIIPFVFSLFAPHVEHIQMLETKK